MVSRLHYKRNIIGFLLIGIALFPFSRNKAGFEIPEDFNLQPSQELVWESTKWFNKTYPEKPIVSFGNFYYAVTLNVDIDDKKECVLIDGVRQNTIEPGTIVFWDNYFSQTDKGITQQDFSNKTYRELRTFKNTNGDLIIAYLKLPAKNLRKD